MGGMTKVVCAVVVVFMGALVFEDGMSFMSTGLAAPSQEESHIILPGAKATPIVGAVVRLAGKAIRKIAAGHRKNKRPSTKQKHEDADARRDRDQDRAKDKNQKGGKDGSKKRPGGKGKGKRRKSGRSSRRGGGGRRGGW